MNKDKIQIIRDYYKVIGDSMVWGKLEDRFIDYILNLIKEETKNKTSKVIS